MEDALQIVADVRLMTREHDDHPVALNVNFSARTGGISGARLYCHFCRRHLRVADEAIVSAYVAEPDDRK